MAEILIGTGIVLGTVFYFIPALIALIKNRRKSIEIIMINIFLGWTVIGWIIALIMTASGEAKEKKHLKYSIPILLVFIILISIIFIMIFLKFENRFSSALVDSIATSQTSISTRSRPRVSEVFNIDIIGYENYGDEMTGIKVKIKNISGKYIERCYLTCVLFKDGKEIDAMSHYAIKSTEGGLYPGEYTYFNYVLSTGRKNFDSVKFHIKNIDF